MDADRTKSINKEHYKRDISFHLRCAKESVERLMGELDPRDVEEIIEMSVEQDRFNLITAAETYEGVE